MDHIFSRTKVTSITNFVKKKILNTRAQFIYNTRHGAVQQEDVTEKREREMLVTSPEGLPRGEQHTAQSGGNR